MNENISLYMTGIKTISGVSIEIDDKYDMLLDPFYASIRDIEIGFDESVKFSETFVKKVSEMIFNKSIYIDMFLRNKKLNLSKEEIEYLKYQYVVCAVIYDAGKHIYIGSMKSNKVRKELGDFIVERNVTFDTSAVDRISDDAKNCMDDIIKAIEDMSSLLAESFIKGEWNKSSSKSYRLWHYPKYQSTVPIAANKILEEDGRYYKTGAGHGYK